VYAPWFREDDMKKLFWVYTVAAILALHSGFAVAGQKPSACPLVKQGVRELLHRSHAAGFEDIADLKSKLDALRKHIKKEKIDAETSREIAHIEAQLDGLVSQLARSLRK
jgi:ribosomal protein S15P/S13E